MGIYHKVERFNPARQIVPMQRKFPQFRATVGNNGEITFKGKFQVKPELPVYTIKIVYRGELSPRIHILDPRPVLDAPHVYSRSESLCLFHQKDFHWSRRKLICEEIMGWTAGWIYFYEFWLQSGTWIGPAAVHGLPVS